MSVLDDLRYSLAPITTPAFDEYLQAIAAMFGQVESYSLDTVDGDGNELPGYGIVFDVDLCPVEALPYLAQFVGETLPTTASEADARARILGQPTRRRGTPAGITAACRDTLTGTRAVFFEERSAEACPTDPAYGLMIRTNASETPDPAATEAAFRSNLPGGIILLYITSDSPVINTGTRTIDASDHTIDTAVAADVT
jgi:hypothetical protein